MNKSKKKISQDYSRNAIADAKSSSASVKKDGKFEAKMAVKKRLEKALKCTEKAL